MRVLVTGAAGRLGSRVSALLHREGFEVVATDVANAGDTEWEFVHADLLDADSTDGLLVDVDAVVHLGNHPGLVLRRPQQVFAENIAMNSNVFQSAAEHGTNRIIFSSTLQLIGSHVDDRTVETAPRQPELPMHGGTVPDPSNLYALSKSASEMMLRYYAERCGIDSVAIRFPMLHNHDERCLVGAGDETATDILEAFTGLTYDDAAGLVVATIRAQTSGYRCYMPATAHRHLDLALPELLQTFYPDVSPELTDLVDISQIVDETGWTLGTDYRNGTST